MQFELSSDTELSEVLFDLINGLTGQVCKNMSSLADIVLSVHFSG